MTLYNRKLGGSSLDRLPVISPHHLAQCPKRYLPTSGTHPLPRNANGSVPATQHDGHSAHHPIKDGMSETRAYVCMYVSETRAYVCMYVSETRASSLMSEVIPTHAHYAILWMCREKGVTP